MACKPLIRLVNPPDPDVADPEVKPRYIGSLDLDLVEELVLKEGAVVNCQTEDKHCDDFNTSSLVVQTIFTSILTSFRHSIQILTTRRRGLSFGRNGGRITLLTLGC